MLEIQYVCGEDWQGLYANGVLKDEGHSISTLNALKIIAECYKATCKVEIKQYFLNQEWLEDQGSLPTEFRKIPGEAFIEG